MYGVDEVDNVATYFFWSVNERGGVVSIFKQVIYFVTFFG